MTNLTITTIVVSTVMGHLSTGKLLASRDLEDSPVWKDKTHTHHLDLVRVEGFRNPILINWMGITRGPWITVDYYWSLESLCAITWHRVVRWKSGLKFLGTFLRARVRIEIPFMLYAVPLIIQMGSEKKISEKVALRINLDAYPRKLWVFVKMGKILFLDYKILYKFGITLFS